MYIGGTDSKGLHHLVSHLVKLVPHLGCPAPHFAGGDEGGVFGWLRYSVLGLELLLRQTEGELHLDEGLSNDDRGPVSHLRERNVGGSRDPP